MIIDTTPTDGIWHIHSPIPRAGGRRILCGATSQIFGQYGDLNEAYRARVEGWVGCGPPCKACLEVAMIAMLDATNADQPSAGILPGVWGVNDDMHRRRVGLVYDIKAMIRDAANQRGASVHVLSSITGLKISAVKGALSPDTGINVLAMFDLAEALDMEWSISLQPKDPTP